MIGFRMTKALVLLSWITLMLFLPEESQATYSISVEIKDEGKIFTITKEGLRHKYGDTVIIDFQIKNHSDTNFFIPNLDEYGEYIADIYEVRNEISIWFLGDFYAEFQTYRKLRLVEIGDSLKFKIKIETGQIEMEDDTVRFDFYIDFGYFEFDKDLLYVTQVEPFSAGLVQLKSEEDLIKLAELHRGLLLGILPLIITK